MTVSTRSTTRAQAPLCAPTRVSREEVKREGRRAEAAAAAAAAADEVENYVHTFHRHVDDERSNDSIYAPDLSFRMATPLILGAAIRRHQRPNYRGLPRVGRGSKRGECRPTKTDAAATTARTSYHTRTRWAAELFWVSEGDKKTAKQRRRTTTLGGAAGGPGTVVAPVYLGLAQKPALHRDV